MSSSNAKIAPNSYNLRIFLLLCALTAFLLLITIRLFNLQVINYAYYKAIASNQHGTEQTLMPKRGEIFLNSRNDSALPVATNINKNLVYLVPKEIEDPTTLASKLAKVLEMDAKEIVEKIKNGNPNYLVIKKQLSEQISEQIKQMKLIGVYLEAEDIRFYPEGRLASHVLGFVGFKGDQRAGQYGIEGSFEENLAGSSGIIGLEKDNAGRWITLATRNLVPASDGDSIYLTIDPAIQFKTEEVLKKTVESHGAKSGSVIILDPKTGAIIALVNFPDFDPNQYNKVSDISVYGNSVLSEAYEPGSVFKPITMAAALNEGKVTPETTYTDSGVVEMDEYKIKNSDGEAHGVQNMTQVLEKSLNTGLVFVEQQLGHDNFKKYVKNFGFGKIVDTELSNEAPGNIDNLNKKGDIFFATSSFGQGISVTPLQLAAAYTAIANNGKMMKPYIVQKIVHSDQTEEETYPSEEGKIIDAKTAATISAMLVNVVENGHGKKAAVPGYYIAGKTGTAQVPFADKVGYDPNRNIGSFVGFGPVDNPAFLMLVKIDSPKDVKFAESTAAPAFGEIARFILNYLQISPSRQ